MKRKGFTLVELLVVMVILGIITAISIPLVRNIRQSNVQKEYQNYLESVKYGAKLYVDSYGEDLFGHDESGCAIISYKDLKEKNLIKDFNLNNISCASENTFVRVVKIGTKYGYAATIGCGKKDSEGNIHITYQYPKEGVVSSETCGEDATAIMSFRTDITNPNSLNYKSRSMKVIISSNTGIHSNPQIQYGFSDQKEGSTVSNWGELTITPEEEDQQIEKIVSGETIEVQSQQIETPEGLTGKYYLVLKIIRLQNINSNQWSNDETSSYVYLGPYTLDNTKPDFQDSMIVSSNDNYNALKPKLNLKVIDELSAPDEASAKEKLKMCTSFGIDTCQKTKTAIEEYEAYDPNKVLDKIKDALDGSMNKVFVTVVDPAGNYQTKEFEYELASVITYNGNGNTGGSTSQTICNNNTDCPLRENGFTRDGHNYLGWYDHKIGGTKYESTTRLTGNITVYAQWDTQGSSILVYTVSENNQCISDSDCSNVLSCSDCDLTINSRSNISILVPAASNWLVEFYKSGTLSTSNSLAVDIHAVGGGGSGASGDIHYRAGGGGGGYTNYVTNQIITGTYEVTVGAGGTPPPTKTNGNDGESSSFGTLVSAAGGKGGHTCDPNNSTKCANGKNDGGDGGAGGSGGGASGYGFANEYKNIDKKVIGGAGGSDGGDGFQGLEADKDRKGKEEYVHSGGVGQGTTTKDFGDGTLRAGGGGGRGGYQSGNAYKTDGGAGGAGGGGNGAKYGSYVAQAGTDHYGGGGGAGAGKNDNGIGGAGGSGIVIIRNKR